MQSAVEPGLGEFQIALDGGFGDAERGGGFGLGEAAEIEKFDEIGFARIDPGEVLEGFIEIDQALPGVWRDEDGILEGDFGDGAAPFFTAIGASVIDQDLAHDAGGDGEEMDAVLPVEAGAEDFEIGFVNETGCVEGAFVLAAQAAMGEGAELRVNDGDQLVVSGGVARAPGAKESG